MLDGHRVAFVKWNTSLWLLEDTGIRSPASISMSVGTWREGEGVAKPANYLDVLLTNEWL